MNEKYVIQQVGTYLALWQEGVSTMQTGVRFLLAQQQDHPLGTVKTQSLKSPHNPELLLASNGLPFKAPLPNFLLFLYKVTFFSFLQPASRFCSGMFAPKYSSLLLSNKSTLLVTSKIQIVGFYF